MRTLVLLAGLMLLGGGVALAWTGRQARDRAGLARLRTLLEHDAAPVDRPTAFAATWSAVGRALERAGERGTWRDWLGLRAERAGWPLRPGEFVLLMAACGAAGGLLLGLAGGAAGVVVGGGAGCLAPLVVLERRVRRAGERADEQLPDVLGRMAASLRAGHSLVHALEAVAERGAPPLGTEFARVLAEHRLGRSLEESLHAMARRNGSTDLRWTVRAILVQHRTGGRLAEVLDVLAEFMRDREEVRREVRALTADGRVSAMVLIGLPFLVAAALMVISPGYLAPLVAEPLGIVMLAGALLLMAVATVWIRRVVRIEV